MADLRFFISNYYIRLMVKCLLLFIYWLIARHAVEHFLFLAVPFLPFLLPTITSLRSHPTTATNIRFFRLLFPAKLREITQLLQSNNGRLNLVVVLHTFLMNPTGRLLRLQRQAQKVHRLELAILVRKKTIFQADKFVY